MRCKKAIVVQEYGIKQWNHLKLMGFFTAQYRNDPKFSDKQIWELL